MNGRYFRVLAAFLLLLTFVAPGMAQEEETIAVLRFGVLPVLNALPIFVADAAGYFEKAGVIVQIGRFRSAVKLRAVGAINGMNGSTAAFQEALYEEESARALLNRQLPPELFFSLAVAIPKFHAASVPSEAEYDAVHDWALTNGIIDEAQAYEDVVDGAYLPEIPAEIPAETPAADPSETSAEN